MARPSRPLLSRPGITAAALAIIDTEGTEALTTRRLATVLGVSSPSLYSHFTTRDDILSGVVELILGDVDAVIDALAPDGVHNRDWRDYLRIWARSYLRALSAHPNAVALVTHSPIRARASLRCFDAAFSCLLQAGFSHRAAADTLLAVDCYVIGNGLDRVSRGFPDPPPSYAEQYPSLAAVLAQVGYRSTDETFENGLDALLDGFAARRTG